jgi:hypothetical protein
MKLRARLTSALALADADAKPIERLYEVTFRKPMLAIQSAVAKFLILLIYLKL